VAKPDWGRKRICYACGSVFYDLSRDPIICPKCDAEFDPEALLKSRRSRPVVVEEVKVKTPAADKTAADEDEDAEEEEDEKPAAADEDTDIDDEDTLIEDPSDLTEDEDDVAEVREHLENDDDDEKN